MELRELKYFIAVAEKGSISKAAESLFLTQPNLSRQMQGLESKLGQKLFVRGNRKITLTEAGKLLKKRAEEIIALSDKTESELSVKYGEIAGRIAIGGGESYAVELIAETASRLQKEYPKIKFDFFSGDTVEVVEKLDKGLIDFGILIEPADLSKYSYLKLPLADTWGVLMKKTSPLAAKPFVTKEDIFDKDLILSKHSLNEYIIADWFAPYGDGLNVVATYNLIYNASLLVKQGLGYALALDKLVDVSEDSELCFRPLKPSLVSPVSIVWKPDTIFSAPSKQFISCLSSYIASYGK